jgi:copper chaperone CopZ
MAPVGLLGVDKMSVNVMFNASRVKLNFDEKQVDIKTIENAITKLGYDVKSSRVTDL